MRETKYRAKPEGLDTWIYGGGYVTLRNGNCMMIYLDDHAMVSTVLIQPDTIGQFTGRYTVDDKEIYEGDIIGYWARQTKSHRSHFITPFRTVEWEERLNGVGWNIRTSRYGSRYKVVGNIYDGVKMGAVV